MKFTATEIKEKSFEKNFRGYDKDEVTEFLKNLAEAWDTLENEKINLEKRLQVAEQEAKKLKDVEASLIRTLKTAEDTGASIIEEANRTAHELLTDAHQSADKMVKDAKMQAERILEAAEKKFDEILNEANGRIKSSLSDLEALVKNRNLILKNLKKISVDLDETLTKSDKNMENSDMLSLSDLLDKLKEVKTPQPQLNPKGEVELIISEESKPVELLTETFENSELNNEVEETVLIEENNEKSSTAAKPSEEVEESMTSEIEEMEENSTSISEETPPRTSQDMSELNESDQKNDKKQGSFFDQLD